FKIDEMIPRTIGVLWRCLRMEIPLFLYMLTSFLKYPVFQSLIYEKSCLERYAQDESLCSNVTAYHNDKDVQADANYFYFLSSLVLIIPSLFSTLALGAASDSWSIKVPLLIPFFGLIICTANYIIQTSYMSASIYYLLISDAFFGVCGGFVSIISTAISYGVKTTTTSRRSVRIASVEAAIGLGGTIGYVLSGTMREALGYSYTFLFMLVLQAIAFFYILIFVEDSSSSHDAPHASTGILLRMYQKSVQALSEYREVLTAPRKFRMLLGLNLLAFGVELLIFAGLMDIQYSYLRYKLGWGDKEYGWFSGLQYGITTLTVMVVYPLLYIRGFTDGILGCLGLLAKIISLVMLAFVANTGMAYSVIVFTSLNRFVSTGFRSFISSIIETNEQGKIFSVIALLEGVTGILASTIFNNLYPKTLHFFPGLLYLASAALLLIPLGILGVSDRQVSSVKDRLDDDHEPRRLTETS
uniref:Proton-coupled folate transporter n=1 Tax=Haemonchus contortus TaxID=6289 RepID=A0A7I4YLN9_HAECO